jgi:uncharacterized protein
MKTTIVWGPPASGKSTYIDKNSGSNSVVYDFDRIMRALSNKPMYQRNENLIGYVAELRTWLVQKLKEDDKLEEAWFSATWVDEEFKSAFTDLQPEYHLIDIPYDECISRLEMDDERAIIAGEMKKVIDRWYDTYGKRSGAMDAERRFLQVEMRAASDENIIEGTPIVYDTETDLGWFREMVAKGAATEALTRSDEFLLFNHDSNQPLARRKNGTLTVTEDDKGVHIKADLSKSSLGPGVYRDIKAGLIDKMSFAFTVEEESWVSPENPKDSDLRIIRSFREIYDYSPVTYPAYKSTELQARSAESILKSHRAATVEPVPSADVEEVDNSYLDVLRLKADLLILGDSK